MTGNGANAKEAVTAKLPWQDNVNAAVDVAWHVPPLCTSLIAGPSRLMGPRPPRQWKRHHKRNKVRSNKEETGSVQSTLKVLPGSGSTEREVLPSCDGCTPNNQRKNYCNCGNGAHLYNRFGGNGAISGLFEELATNCVRDHHFVDGSSAVDSCSKQRLGHDREATEALTNGNGAEWSERQDKHQEQNDKKVRFSPTQLHQNMLP